MSQADGNYQAALRSIKEAKKKNERGLGLIWFNLKQLPAEIGQLNNLISLDLSYNKLTELPAEITQLNNLIRLNLSYNKLTELPVEITQLKNLETLLLHGNFLDIPPELFGDNDYKNKDAQKILAYLRDRAYAGDKSLNETKMLVVGQGGVGKTSLINQLLGYEFDPNNPNTNGIDIHHLDLALDERKVRVNIWDFGGQEVMHSTHQFFLTQRSLYVYVLDARIERDANKLDYWLNLIEQYGGKEVPILLVINKVDNNLTLNLDESALQSKYNIKAIIRTSCASGEGIAELKQTISHQIDFLPHVNDTIPASWFNVKQALEVEKKRRDIIEFSSFREMCDAHSVGENSQGILLHLLHDLGTVLNFYGKTTGTEAEPALEETNILNPEWVTDGVYAILNSEQVYAQKGILNRNDLSNILDQKLYVGYKNRSFILGMMKQFELAFQIGGSNRFLVPDLLSENDPYITGFNETLNFEYRYVNFFPHNVFSRFIVRQHEKIQDRENELWRNGVVIHFDGMRALVRADVPSKRIRIAVLGDPKRRRELLAIIRATFNDIHSRFKKEIAQAMVPIPGELNAAVPYKMLLMAEAEGQARVPVMEMGRYLDVRPLLDGIDGPKSNEELLELLRKRFNKAQLKTFLFKLGIDYENVEASNQGKEEFAMEIVRKLQRTGQVEALLKKLKQ